MQKDERNNSKIKKAERKVKEKRGITNRMKDRMKIRIRE